MTLKSSPLSLTVNGKPVGPIDVPDDMMLLDVLHEYLGLTGSRMACGQGICHACAVILDGPSDGPGAGPREIRSCITGAHFFSNKSIRTVEGHAERDAQGNVVRLSPVQQAFIEHFSFQCGYCTPGFVTAATVLVERLKKEPVARRDLEAAIDKAMGQHICRCTGYVRYFEAVRDLVLATPGLVRG
jgi:aerobic-type carbon monoxide dehydrogenase small subunit (CoxS/CutS family)